MTIVRLREAPHPIADRQTLCAAVLAILAGAVFWVRTFEPSLRSVTHGFPVYYVSARLLVEGRWTPAVYDDAWFSAQVKALSGGRVGEVYSAHPPITSLLMLSLAWLDMSSARVAWLTLNLALLPAALLAILSTIGRIRSPAFAAGFFAFALAYPPLRENFRLAQAYAFLLFLYASAVWGFSRQRSAIVGLALGTAAATKFSGGPLWLLLAARGHWRDALACGLVAALFVIASLLLTGVEAWAGYLSILPDHLLGRIMPPVLAFQTTPSFFQRWHPPWLAVVFTAGVAVAALGLTLRRSRRSDFALAFAAAATLSVVLQPLAEEYHYTLLVLPLAVMAARVLRRPIVRADVAWLLLILSLLAIAWPYKLDGLTGSWAVLLGYPRLYGGWLLWAWLIRQMRPRRAGEA